MKRLMATAAGLLLALSTPAVAADVGFHLPSYDEFLAAQIKAARMSAGSSHDRSVGMMLSGKDEDAAEARARADAPAAYMQLLEQYERLKANGALPPTNSDAGSGGAVAP